MSRIRPPAILRPQLIPLMSQPVSGGETSGRLNNFDFLRLVLAVAVIFSHSFPLLWGDNRDEPLMRLTGGQVTAGELAVAGFFVLSGFLITKSWLRSPGVVDYLRKRVLRIYPGFLASLAFCAFVVGPLAADRPADYWRGFPFLTFLVQGLNLQGPVTPPVFGDVVHPVMNGSLWSIRYEFLCYVGVAALGLLGVLRRPPLVLLVFVGVFTVFVLQVQVGLPIRGSRYSWVYGLPGLWPRLGSSFLAGSVFYVYRDRIVYSRGLFAAAIFGLAVAAALPFLRCLTLAIPVLGAYAFFYLGFLPAPGLRGFARRGDLSYGMYLYAFPVQQLLIERLGAGLHPLALFPLATAFTAVLAASSWRFVERPFLKLKSAGPSCPGPVTAAGGRVEDPESVNGRT